MSHPGVTLSGKEFDFLWESYGAGDVPYPLKVPSHGRTANERAALRQQTLAELSGRGIIAADDDLEPGLTGHFQVLAGAQVTVDAVHVVERDGPVVAALAGQVGEMASLAVQDGPERLQLWGIEDASLASTIVSLLPPTPRGTERSVSLPVEQMMTTAGADFLRRASADGSPDDDRKILARLIAQPRVRAGQLGVNRRSDTEGRTRAPVLSWFDTESGRYLTRASEGVDGTRWVTIAPADAATLRQAITEMLSDLGAVDAAASSMGSQP